MNESPHQAKLGLELQYETNPTRTRSCRADQKPGTRQLARSCWCRFCRDCSRTLIKPIANTDLIAFLQALPEGRKHREVRYPQWLLLLMAILGVLSGCHSARDLERFDKQHHQAFSAALDVDMPKAPCDSTFLYLLSGWNRSSSMAYSCSGCSLRSQIRTGKSSN